MSRSSIIRSQRDASQILSVLLDWGLGTVLVCDVAEADICVGPVLGEQPSSLITVGVGGSVP